VCESHTAQTCRSLTAVTVFNFYFHHKKALQFEGRGCGGIAQEEINFYNLILLLFKKSLIPQIYDYISLKGLTFIMFTQLLNKL
jgi:hypothetical protein